MTYRHSVFKDWIFTLPYRMQSVLTSSLRGCDTARKDDNSKFITRAIRGLVLNNADPSNTFIVGDGVPEEKYVTSFLWDLDSYPMHFIMHTAHACEIIGYKHPEPTIRAYWIAFYKKVVKGLHLNPETEEQIDVRLGFTPDEQAKIAVAERPLELRGTPIPREAPVAPLMRQRQPQEPVAPPARPPPVVPDARWDAGTGTSHGGRDRPYSGGS
jgi:hypothetical protein